MKAMKAHLMEQRKKGKVKFIQSAIKRPGALTKKAKAAGESVSEFASEKEHASGRTGQEARFYNHVLKKAKR